MVGLIPPQTVLTTASATNDLQSFGLEALGLSAPALSPVWASATPTQYSQDALTLQLQDTRAPFRGIAAWESTPSAFSDSTGAALSGPALVLQLHPEAARRLQIEIDLRLGANIYPTPVALVLRGLTPPATLPPPQIYLASESLQPTGLATASFHDARGLPIDPIAMAHLWNDLVQWRPALQDTKQIPGNPGLMDAGGVGKMLNLQSGVIVHVIDPHGWRYASQRPQASLHILDTNGVEAASFPASAVLKLENNQTLGRTTAEQTADQAAGWAPLRWGFARNGTLGTAALVPPPVPPPAPLAVAIGCRFIRVMAVDLDWHLLGNRTTVDFTDGVAGNVAKEDGATPSFLVPKVRDPVPGFGWLSSASDVLGAMAAAAQGVTQPGDHLAIAVSPAIDSALTTPPAPGAEWPTFPPPPPGAGEISATADPRVGIKANWRNPADGPPAKQDVVLTLDGAQLPLGAHVRAYPRSFVEIQSIGAQPSFVRGDGGAAIATAGDVTLLLVNPFGLGADEPHPTTPLIVDLVVVSRSGKRRIYSATKINVDAAVKSPGDAGFQGTAVWAPGGFLATMLDGLKTRAIAPLPLFGLPRPPGSALPANPTLKDLLTRLATDEQPRQGPRLPTQARFDSAFVVAAIATGQTTPVWQAVVSGVRFSSESRHARPDLANPGNPAGPDVFAAGTVCRGRLAYDIAVHALKRAQPIFVPDTPTSFHGWIATLMDPRWNPAPDTTGTVAGAALETIAAFCDTPELAAAPVPAPGATLQNLLNTIANAIGVSAPTGSIGNEQVVVPIVQREIATARSGQRDALWSLNRAFSQAREFIYIESPGFGRTARPPANPKPYQLDLAAVIATKMASNPRLKLIICVPREGDFDRSRAPWTVTALASRKQLLDDLIGVDPKRVAAFHPFGFPGRAPAIRTTTVIVDDVYCLSGTSHFRRRGMTFDGALDIANFDRTLAEGYSKGIADFRRRLLAEKLGVVNATTVAAANSLWLRLGSPEGMFNVIRELLAEGGAGRLQPVWSGPTPDGILPKDDKYVDPDGVDGDAFLGLFASMLVED